MCGDEGNVESRADYIILPAERERFPQRQPALLGTRNRTSRQAGTVLGGFKNPG